MDSMLASHLVYDMMRDMKDKKKFGTSVIRENGRYTVAKLINIAPEGMPSFYKRVDWKRFDTIAECYNFLRDQETK